MKDNDFMFSGINQATSKQGTKKVAIQKYQ